MNRVSVKNMCAIAVAAAVVAVLSQIAIPTPLGVVMTLQTFVVPLVGCLLGWKRGTIALVVYLLLGAVGAPVFAEFSGGFHCFVGPTGGFLLGFPLMAMFAGFAAHQGGLKRAMWLLAGVVVDYSLGVAVFMLVTGSGLWAALQTCVFIFLPLEAVKQVCVWVLAPRLSRVLERAGAI